MLKQEGFFWNGKKLVCMEICWTEKRLAHVCFYMTLCAKKMIVKKLFPMKNTKAWEIICVCNYISNGPFASQWHQCVGKSTSLHSYRKSPNRKDVCSAVSATEWYCPLLAVMPTSRIREYVALGGVLCSHLLVMSLFKTELVHKIGGGFLGFGLEVMVLKWDRKQLCLLFEVEITGLFPGWSFPRCSGFQLSAQELFIVVPTGDTSSKLMNNIAPTGAWENQ